MTKSALPIITLIAAATLALNFALQYPLLATFPIGGDAPHYIKLVQSSGAALSSSPLTFLSSFTKSAYPLSHILIMPSGFFPNNWPDHFIWWTTIAQITSSLAIGLLALRLGGWRSAAAAMAIWSLSVISINNHFEDGTLAQLISLTFLLLFFERIIANTPIRALLALFAAWLTHPVTGIILLITITLATPYFFIFKKHFPPHQRKIAKAIIVFNLLLLILVTIAIFQNQRGLLLLTKDMSNHISLQRTIFSPFGPFILLLPVGLIVFARKFYQNKFFFILFSGFAFSSTFLAFNHFMNIGFWTHRFQTYFIILITLSASLALPIIIRAAFRQTSLRIIFIFLFFIILTAKQWQHNTSIYSRYESQLSYNRLLASELAGIKWMKSNLPRESNITTTTVTRHAEWIPVLTSLNWGTVSSDTRYFSDLYNNASTYREYEKDIPKNPNQYFVFFTGVEDVNENVLNHPEFFSIVFHNQAIVIAHTP